MQHAPVMRHVHSSTHHAPRARGKARTERMERRKAKVGTPSQRRYADSGKKENAREEPTADIYTPQHKAQEVRADGTGRTSPKIQRCATISKTTGRAEEVTIADSHTENRMNKPT